MSGKGYPRVSLKVLSYTGMWDFMDVWETMSQDVLQIASWDCLDLGLYGCMGRNVLDVMGSAGL